MKIPMQTVTVRLTGTRPLLLNNPQLVHPFNPYKQRIDDLTPKRGQKQTRTEFDALQRAKWEGTLYHDPELGPYVTDAMVIQSLIEGAKFYKQGALVERSAIIEPPRLAIEYRGPRDIEAMWKAGIYADEREVGIGKSKVITTRAIFPEWSLSVPVTIDVAQASAADVLRWAEAAGRFRGLGTYRKRFGRFAAAASGKQGEAT